MFLACDMNIRELQGKPVQISHMTDVVQTPALCRLAQCIRQRREQWQPGEEAPDLERFEQELHAHVMAFECEMLADERRRYDVSAAEVPLRISPKPGS